MWCLMVEKTFGSAKELKEGRYVLIDGIPCRVVQIESSRPGKHGSAKMRITGIGVFNGQKKILLSPSDADIEIPVIERKTVQILTLSGNVANVMDAQSYETYDIEIPEEHLDNVEPGKEAEIMVCMGRKKFERVRWFKVKLENLEEKQNKLLERKEIIANIVFEGATPKREEIKNWTWRKVFKKEEGGWGEK